VVAGIVAVLVLVTLVVQVRFYRSGAWRIQRPRDGWLWDRPLRMQARFWAITIPLTLLGIYVAVHLQTTGGGEILTRLLMLGLLIFLMRRMSGQGRD
jgi:hypothetical protein